MTATPEGDPSETAEVEEAALLLSAQAGDDTALAALYTRYVARVYRYFFARLHDAHDAEDLTSRTFVSVIESLPRYRHRGLFAAWLFCIARRKAIEHYRRQRPQQSIHDLEASARESDPERIVVQSQERLDLEQLIRALPEADQELLRLRYVAGLSFAEIAGVVGKSTDASKKGLYRVLSRLRDQRM